MSNPFAGLGLAAFGMWLALGQPQVFPPLPWFAQAHAEPAVTAEPPPGVTPQQVEDTHAAVALAEEIETARAVSKAPATIEFANPPGIFVQADSWAKVAEMLRDYPQIRGPLCADAEAK